MLLFVADVGAVVVGCALAFLIQAIAKPVSERNTQNQLILLVLSIPIWMIAMVGSRLYIARANRAAADELRNIATACVIGGLSITSLAFVLKVIELSRLWVVLIVVCTIAALGAERRVANRVFVGLRASGRLVRRILVVGTDSDCISLVHAMRRNPELGYEPIGFVGPDDLGSRGGVTVLGGVDDVMAVLDETGVDNVILSPRTIRPAALNGLARKLTDRGVHVTMVSSLTDIASRRIRLQELDGRALLYIEPTIRDGWRRIAKRTFDVLFAALGLLVTAPVLLASAMAIWVETGGPVCFRQQRVGRDGQPFEIIKLRTMVVDAEQRRDQLEGANESDGALFKIRSDPRVTSVGRVLRKFSIDEIPQFWNVIRGEMSVVGPRPALLSEVAQWSDDLHDRLRVLPGITGLWQVSGRSNVSFAQYKRLDLYYVDNWSLRHDLHIVARTFVVVAAGSGAS
ncbi:sugar transferase [Ilumatobacter nonamiensis]|uniref:sugar transferase n=1 Tax=Ilumatobacter nonamiensis TaxID=467093 RepID=UPI0009FEF7BE|nr:sugar transferase [Ilumatobacter nonamiensis]